MPGKLAIHPFDERFFGESGRWLANPDVRRLTMSPVVDECSRRRWFETLPTRKDYWIWGVCLEDRPIACFGIKHVDSSLAAGEYWGYIGEPSLWGHGIGSWMLEQALNKAHKSGLHEIYLRVWTQNIRAIRLYRRFGFQDCETDNDVLTMAIQLKG